MMTRNSFKIIVFAIGIFLTRNNVFANNDFKILAYVNEKAITKADLKASMKITKNNDSKKALKEYIELIQYAEIAEKNGIKLDKRDKAELWTHFKVKFKIYQTKSEFCKKNGIDEKFLDDYMRMMEIWKIYYENFIVRNVNVQKDTIIENLKVTGKAKIENSYDLSEIVLYYSDNKQKKEVENKIKNLLVDISSNKISFIEAVKSISNSKTTKDNGYLGWVNSSDFNDSFANVIEKTNVGCVTNVICTDSSTKGLCAIFMVHDSKIVINTDKKEEIHVFNDFHKKTIDVKTIETVSSYGDTIKVKYNL